MRALVKGAGVAGLTVAFELRRHGYAVEVADGAESVGTGASGLAGGMLAPFCEGESAPEAVTRLGRAAADWWEAALPDQVNRYGTLVVAPLRDTGELTRFAARTTGREWLEEEGIAALEPALAGRFRKALFFRGEAHLDPRKALSALHAQLVKDGVHFRFGASSHGYGTGFDAVFDCTGAAAVGAVPSLRGVRGELLHLHTSEMRLSRPVRLLHPRHPIYVVPRADHHFMVGATMIETNEGGAISARSLMELLNAAYALHPAFGEARVIETGAGVRPAFDDNLPLVTRIGDTIHVNGFYRHGFLLAPAMAQEAVALLERVSA